MNATCILELGAYKLYEEDNFVFSLVPANCVAIKPNGKGLYYKLSCVVLKSPGNPSPLTPIFPLSDVARFC